MNHAWLDQSQIDKYIRESKDQAGPLQKPCKVHVLAPRDWTRQEWSVVRDDGGLFCTTFFARTPEGHDAKARAELIAKAVNEYLERNPGSVA